MFNTKQIHVLASRRLTGLSEFGTLPSCSLFLRPWVSVQIPISHIMTEVKRNIKPVPTGTMVARIHSVLFESMPMPDPTTTMKVSPIRREMEEYVASIAGSAIMKAVGIAEMAVFESRVPFTRLPIVSSENPPAMIVYIFDGSKPFSVLGREDTQRNPQDLGYCGFRLPRPVRRVLSKSNLGSTSALETP